MASNPITVPRRMLPRSLKRIYDIMDQQSASKRYTVDIQIVQADLIAPVSQEIVAGFDGFITGLDTIVQAAITTGGTLKVQLNTVDVAGATVTIANADAKGSRKSASFTKIAVSRGDRITLVPAGFATAGAVNVTLGMTAN
jgi:hypothetical protein